MSLISNNQLFYKDGKHNEDPGNEDYCEFDGDVDVDEFGDGDDNDNGDGDGDGDGSYGSDGSDGSDDDDSNDSDDDDNPIEGWQLIGGSLEV